MPGTRLAPLFSLPLLVFALRAQDLDAVDVVWRTPCTGPEQSMPIGNGEVGCNVWCTADGVVHGLVARTDSFSEASRLLKLGAFALPLRRPDPGEFFEQRLQLAQGAIRVTIGEGPARVVASVFVDSDADVVHLVVDSEAMRSGELRLHSWRQSERRLLGDELASSWTMKDAPAEVEVIESADVREAPREPLAPDGGGALLLRHGNQSSVVTFTAARQGLPADAVADLLLGRTFGLVAVGEGAGFGSSPDLEQLPLLAGSRQQHAFRIA
ncbi:MAG: DUF5703 domain-containing protein, partial [Planctomycetes bacterium]|nr:DUF5703 domain-containing protein [Planctomycetota bacterium]